GRVNATNQIFWIGISNFVALEAWNSYSTPFPRELEMRVFNSTTSVLTNDDGLYYTWTNSTLPVVLAIAPGKWQGRQLVAGSADQSMMLPLTNDQVVITNA